jgi:hypothetical protein
MNGAGVVLAGNLLLREAEMQERGMVITAPDDRK